MQVREMEYRDNKSVEQIIKRSLESVDLDIPGTAYFDPQLRNLAQFYKQQSKANYWVAVNEQDEVVGGIGIAPFGEKLGVCELQKLYIAPAAQGMGLSKELMKAALEFARKNYTYCYLETMEKLSAANSLYVQFGFRQLESALDDSVHTTMDTWFLKEL